jgi:hypothetical protein
MIYEGLNTCAPAAGRWESIYGRNVTSRAAIVASCGMNLRGNNAVECREQENRRWLHKRLMIFYGPDQGETVPWMQEVFAGGAFADVDLGSIET